MRGLKILTTFFLALLILVFAFSGAIKASTTGDVTATVTLQNVSVSITANGTFAYGTLTSGSSKSTVDLSKTITASNDGNIAEKLNIKGANSTGCVWTLDASAGSETYKHEFSTNGGSSYTALTTGYQELAASVASSGTQNFDLQITVPTSSSCFSETTVTVTVQATTP